MQRNRAIRRILARAVSLLALAALVVALVQAGPAAMAASAATQSAHSLQSAPAPDDCAHHAAQHEATYHHAHVALISPGADDESDAGQSADHAHHHHTHPCCVSVASIVLPALAMIQLPVPAGGPRVMGDVAERLETHAPEGPNEPPRTGDMS